MTDTNSRKQRRAFTKGKPGRATKRAAYLKKFRGGTSRAARRS
jgi:hypothetical protein